MHCSFLEDTLAADHILQVKLFFFSVKPLDPQFLSQTIFLFKHTHFWDFFSPIVANLAIANN